MTPDEYDEEYNRIHRLERDLDHMRSIGMITRYEFLRRYREEVVEALGRLRDGEFIEGPINRICKAHDWMREGF